MSTTKPSKFNNEGDVKKFVKAMIGEMQMLHPGAVWYFMPPANGYGRSGIPDFVGCVRGRMFAIETKFGTNKPTAHQVNEMAALMNARSKVWIVRETTVDVFANEFSVWCGVCS